MIMKLKMFFMLLAAGLLSLNLQSCDDDDDKGIAVSAELQNAFAEKYPNTQVVKWETEGAHYVAEFYNDRYEADAWFTPDGIWQMTETDLPYDALPAAVRSAFQSSQYAQWKVEDVDMVERRAMETVYVIEVESGNQEMDLHYNVDGILVKEVPDTDGGAGSYLPSDLADAMRTFIEKNYPGASIVETDYEANWVEVDIIHDRTAKEVRFTTAGEWVSTSWDIRLTDVPQVVKDAALAAHAGFVMDDADYVQTPAGDCYLIELEKGEQDVYVKVQADGTVLQ